MLQTGLARDGLDTSVAPAGAKVELTLNLETLKQESESPQDDKKAWQRALHVGARAAVDQNPETALLPEAEAAALRASLPRHVCACLSILPERVRVTTLYTDVSSWSTGPVVRATVEIAAAAPGQTHSSGITCALALASQAGDASSPLRKRLPALLSGQLADRARCSPASTLPRPSATFLASPRPPHHLALGGAGPSTGTQELPKTAPLPAESLKATSMGLVGKESYGDVQRASDSQTPAASGVRTPREQQVRGEATGGGGWAGVKLQGQQQVLKGPPHAARQFPRGYLVVLYSV